MKKWSKSFYLYVELKWQRKLIMFQTLSFYFMECGEIPPPVIQVQNVSFRYKDDAVGEQL